ncbi:MAG: hypothetical protein ACYTAF_06600 [Planctomycetota bacterium]|jgi:hypothetical protein
MNREQVRKSALLYLYWMGSLGAVLVVVAADLLPFRLAFVSPENLFVCLIEAEIFFVLAVWPLFIPSILRLQENGPKERTHAPILFLHILLMLLFALPLALICTSVSDAGAGLFFRGHLLVAVLAFFVAALFDLAHTLRLRIAVWYYMVFFLASAALPFLYFVIREHGASGPEFLSFFSPFWAALLPAPALVQSAIFGGLAVALVLVVPFVRRGELDSPSTAG